MRGDSRSHPVRVWPNVGWPRRILGDVDRIGVRIGQVQVGFQGRSGASSTNLGFGSTTKFGLASRGGCFGQTHAGFGQLAAKSRFDSAKLGLALNPRLVSIVVGFCLDWVLLGLDIFGPGTSNVGLDRTCIGFDQNALPSGPRAGPRARVTLQPHNRADVCRRRPPWADASQPASASTPKLLQGASLEKCWKNFGVCPGVSETGRGVSSIFSPPPTALSGLSSRVDGVGLRPHITNLRKHRHECKRESILSHLSKSSCARVRAFSTRVIRSGGGPVATAHGKRCRTSRRATRSSPGDP